MHRLLIAAVTVFLLGTPGALAACLLTPDNADSRYVENGQAYALCLQQDLSATAAAAATQARIDAAIEATRIELERLRRMQIQMSSNVPRP